MACAQQGPALALLPCSRRLNGGSEIPLNGINLPKHQGHTQWSLLAPPSGAVVPPLPGSTCRSDRLVLELCAQPAQGRHRHRRPIASRQFRFRRGGLARGPGKPPSPRRGPWRRRASSWPVGFVRQPVLCLRHKVGTRGKKMVRPDRGLARGRLPFATWRPGGAVFENPAWSGA